ncbi:MAG: cation:proton antiporter, partial [Clostridia bacterium]|nr:cation:proton antiporter [Clostridia bacterium]
VLCVYLKDISYIEAFSEPICPSDVTAQTINAHSDDIRLVKLFKHINKRKPNVHRVPIYSLAICFFYAYVSENIFGVADITGAYIAGAILSVCRTTAVYADRKIDVGSYMIFSPLFFAYIGIQISFSSFNDPKIILIAVLFVLFAIIGKIVGCGSVARLAKLSVRDSAIIGIGMIARGELALAVTATGIEAGLIASDYVAMTVLLVLVSSILAPILLKIFYRNDKPELIRPEEAEGSYE